MIKMGQIKKKEIRILEDSKEEERISYCPSCEEYGFREMLGPKILLRGQARPTDYDKWLQCISCGRVYPIYEAKIESKLQDFVEVSDNPFDAGQNIVGIGIKKPKSSYEKQRQKLLERIENQKDEDIKAELRKGIIVQV